ncbi:hypothetical protein [Streptomyces sp. Ru72]|uniref:hypothetical protein n=1 Tax=Streptomyces sp. Ru72 TaxID=2080747 RepID=UPI00215664BE|nr:hypothetical protein [Streptomyces sp. Ru72]
MFTRRPRHGWRQTVRSGAIALTLLGGAVPAAGVGATPALAEDAAASVTADSTPESEASALAAKTGERVAVDAATTESSQVFANPDGTFTQEMNAAPVRARKDDGTWAPIDGWSRWRTRGVS